MTAPEPAKNPPHRPTGVRRIAYVSAGLFFVGVAYVGAITPGLPTVPWLLLASYCFDRSSPRLHAWLRRTPLFGPLIRDWEDNHGVRPRVKLLAVTSTLVVVTLSITLSNLPTWVKCVIGGLAACGISTILFLVPTIRDKGEPGA